MATETSLPSSWYDLWKLDEPLDFDEFLKSDLLASGREAYRNRTFIVSTAGSISIIASSLLIVHILRTHDALSTVYHRLVLGLSCADITSSTFYILTSIMVPKELTYWVPGANGNTATCTAQGFFIFTGALIACYYNCSICFYYLAIIKYDKKDEYIQKKLEPWFHGISILVPLVVTVTALFLEMYNTWGLGCAGITYQPPHCIGYKSGHIIEGFRIPCGRGDGRQNPKLYIVVQFLGYGSVLVITPTVIIGSMLLMYKSVSKVEKRRRSYGVNSLRFSVQELKELHSNLNLINDADVDSESISNRRQSRARISSQLKNGLGLEEEIEAPKACGSTVVRNVGSLTSTHSRRSSVLWPPENLHLECEDGWHVKKTIRRMFKSLMLRCCQHKEQQQQRSTKIKMSRIQRAISQKERAIVSMAFGYALAWALVIIPFMMISFLPGSIVMDQICACLYPLQGFFNFVVFMAPKVRIARKASISTSRGSILRSSSSGMVKKLTWWQAFLKAYTSRGEKRRTVSSLRSSSVYSRRPSSILSRKSSNRSGTMAGFANDWNPSIAGPTRTRAPISAASSTPAGQGADAAASHREIPLMVSPNASASESTDEDTTTARQRPQHPTIFTNATKEKIREQMRVE
jgi:hypothetical protein